MDGATVKKMVLGC